jgi:phosphopantetheinyl transferase
MRAGLSPGVNDTQAPYLWSGLPTADLEEQALNKLEDVLDADEQASISRLRRPQARRDAIVAHGLRRLVLATATGRPAGSFRFYTDRAGGKPKLAGAPDIDISLTHCNGYAAATVSKGCRIGIDAEPLSRHIEPEVMATFTANAEFAGHGQLGRLAPIDLWTLKEALSKAEGSGLGLNFRRLEIAPCATRLIAAPESFGDPADWRLERHCHAGFTVAIAFGPGGGR